jgi:hypothetical protein
MSGLERDPQKRKPQTHDVREQKMAAAHAASACAALSQSRRHLQETLDVEISTEPHSGVPRRRSTRSALFELDNSGLTGRHLFEDWHDQELELHLLLLS